MLKRLFQLTVIFLFILTWSSCRNDFEFEPSTGGLEFSKDTVYLDTVFSNISSSTYTLKVYNRSNKDIVIPNINLSKRENSRFRLNIDGSTGSSGDLEGKVFEDVELLAKDSLYIFIETTIDISNQTNSNELLYTDKIEFDQNNNLQTVELVTLVKDAVFIYPARSEDTDEDGNPVYIKETLVFDVDGDGEDDETTLEGRFLNDNELNFTNDKPYVIYGYAGVGANKTLTIDPGARIHFHANSGLIVTQNASMKINGALSNDLETMENEVIFESDRLEPGFADIPGQWGTILLYNDSKEIDINHTTIKNGTVGLFCIGNQENTIPKVSIKNSKLFNFSSFGILARASSLKAENLVISNCGQSAFAGTLGGSYEFTHATLSNYWTNSFRQFPAVLVNNFITDEDDVIYVNSLDKATFTNCIVYGSENIEFLVDQADSELDFNFKLESTLLRFNDYNNSYTGPNYNFNNSDLYNNVMLNQNPEFWDAYNNNFLINENSAAINKGDVSAAQAVPNDILGVNRSSNPDLGAYQHQVQPED